MSWRPAWTTEFSHSVSKVKTREAILLIHTYFLDGLENSGAITGDNQGWISKLEASHPSLQPHFWFCRRLYWWDEASPSKHK